MFSCLRRQDRKAPKFSHLINITCCTFNTSPHRKISRLRSNESWWQNNFFTHLIHFLYQNLEKFPWVTIRSVSKTQQSNGTISSYRSVSKAISTSFIQRNDASSWCVGVAFLPQSRDCNQSVPATWSLLLLHHNNQNIVLGGQKPSLAVLQTAPAFIWQHWHVEADLPLQPAGNDKGTQAANNIWRS
jgi:hypothetical protein